MGLETILLLILVAGMIWWFRLVMKRKRRLNNLKSLGFDLIIASDKGYFAAKSKKYIRIGEFFIGHSSFSVNKNTNFPGFVKHKDDSWHLDLDVSNLEAISSNSQRDDASKLIIRLKDTGISQHRVTCGSSDDGDDKIPKSVQDSIKKISDYFGGKEIVGEEYHDGSEIWEIEFNKAPQEIEDDNVRRINKIKEKKGKFVRYLIDNK